MAVTVRECVSYVMQALGSLTYLRAILRVSGDVVLEFIMRSLNTTDCIACVEAGVENIVDKKRCRQ